MSQRPLGLTDGYSMPVHRPYYPPLPTHYRDARFQLLYFRADPDRIAPLIPEPFTPSPDGLCVAFTIDVPFTSDYGPFCESGVMERVLFRSEPGFYPSHVWLNNVRAIVSGRERWGTPKMYADVQLEENGNVLSGTTTADGLPLMRMRTQIGKPASATDMVPMFPGYRLKVIPRADGPGFALKQVITIGPTAATTEFIFKGEGTIAFDPAADWDVAALAPVEILDAFYLVSSYEESYGEIVFEVRPEDLGD